MYLNLELYHSNFNSQVCPNCGKTLSKISKRKFSCPNCSGAIYYRLNPQTHLELLLSSDEKEIFEYYKAAFYEFNKESTIKTLLASELNILDSFRNEISQNLISTKIIPIILKESYIHIKNRNLGLYANSLLTLGYLYAANSEYDTAFDYLAFRTYLLINGIQNNMPSLNLNLLPLDTTYLYIDYSSLIYIFFLKYPYLPLDFDKFYNFYCSMPLNTNITYRYSVQETYLMIIDLLKKYI